MTVQRWVVARSSSWQVVTGIGLMLIGAALQWANKAMLIGGQGHNSRTFQTGASAKLMRNCIHTNSYMHIHTGQTVASAPLSSSPRLSGIVVLCIELLNLSEGNLR